MRAAAFLCLAVMCASPPARGQPVDPFAARGIDLVPNKMTPAMESGLALEGGELLLARSFLLQAMLDLNVGLLEAKNGSERLGELIPFRADLHLLGSYQLHPRVEASLDLPITIGQVHGFGILERQGFPLKAPNTAGLGAPRLLGRVQILRQSELPIVGLAGVLEVRLPIGDTFSFMSDRGFVLAPRLAVERSIGPARVLGNLGWRLRTAPGRFMNLYVAQEFTLGGGAIIELPTFGPFQGNQLLGEIDLATPAEAPFTFSAAESLKTPMELLLGARTRFGNGWGLQLIIGKGLGATGYGRETIRFALTVSYEHRAESDRDGDQIPDRVDPCPDVPEDLDGVEDTDGCPEEREPDRDNDGTLDRFDVCPDTPGPRELDGCPDRDGDQIPDNVDKCPDQPGPPELQGCPPPEEEEKVVLESERIRINNQILFEFGSDRIDPRSFPLLDEVAAVLAKNPDVGPVMIEGHTDSVGSNEMNLGLSKRRAKAVEKYLIAKGIAAARLRSEGYGYHRPVAPNDTVLNRAKNRRTEFKLTEEIVTPPKEKPAPKKGASPAPEQATGKPPPAQKPVAPPVKKPMPSGEPAPKK